MHGKAIYMPMLCATKYFVYSAISRANVKNLVVGELLTIRRGVQKDFCGLVMKEALGFFFILWCFLGEWGVNADMKVEIEASGNDVCFLNWFDGAWRPDSISMKSKLWSNQSEIYNQCSNGIETIWAAHNAVILKPLWINHLWYAGIVLISSRSKRQQSQLCSNKFLLVFQLH